MYNTNFKIFRNDFRVLNILKHLQLLEKILRGNILLSNK